MPFKKIQVQPWLTEELKNEEFKTSYELIKVEYELINQLVKFRKEKKVSQEQLAAITGVSQQAISRLEREKHLPKLDTLLRIVEGLGLRLELKEHDDCLHQVI